MADTHCDNLINSKSCVINKILDTQPIIALMVNDQNVAVDTELYDSASDHILDYRYVDETIQESGAWIMVETEITSAGATMNDMTIYVEVMCSKSFMRLNGWTGVSGNRRDNLLRQIDFAIRGSRDFGIGRLELLDIRVVSAPANCTSILATYTVPDFAKKRGFGNYV